MIAKTKQKVLEKGRPSQKEPRVLRSNIANKGRNGATILKEQNIDAGVAQSIQQARERYARLVDRKFKQSLTLEEQLELESITSLLDKAEKPFYEPIIQRLIVERDLVEIRLLLRELAMLRNFELPDWDFPSREKILQLLYGSR